MGTLVSFQDAKDHLRVTGNDENGQINLKLEQASELIFNHVNSGADAGWLDGTVPVPGDVQAATCVMLTYLYEHRGDAMDGSANIWAAIERILVTTRRSPVA
jgi:Phage gp6-like head-tail connector protein